LDAKLYITGGYLKMAKKELVSDIPEFDTDFNFDFENEIDGELNQEATGEKKSRGVVGNVFMGALTGAKDEVVSPTFVKDTLRKSLPDTYGEVADAAGELTTGMYELYDETVREIKPRVGRVTAKINQLVPDSAKRLKALTEKIARWGGEDIGQEQNSTPNQEEQAVAMSLAGVFEQQKEQGKLDDAKDLIRDRIGTKRFSANFDLQRSMERSLSIQTQYTVNTNQRFQRKSLELQVRSLLAQKEHFSKSQASFKVFQAQLEAVVKNTAMPEYVKITESERFKEIGKRKFIESLYGDKSFLKQGMERLKDTVRQTVSGFTSALDQADMHLDSTIDAKEMLDGMNAMMVDMGAQPLTKAEMLGATAGANIASWFRDVMAKRIKEIGGDDDVIQEKFAGLANIINNPSGSLEKLRQSQGWIDKTNDSLKKPSNNLTLKSSFRRSVIVLREPQAARTTKIWRAVTLGKSQSLKRNRVSLMRSGALTQGKLTRGLRKPSSLTGNIRLVRGTIKSTLARWRRKCVRTWVRTLHPRVR
jgi:hypothetical protein